MVSQQLLILVVLAGVFGTLSMVTAQQLPAALTFARHLPCSNAVIWLALPHVHLQRLVRYVFRCSTACGWAHLGLAWLRFLGLDLTALLR